MTREKLSLLVLSTLVWAHHPQAFSPRQMLLLASPPQTLSTPTALHAKPQRLKENVDGVVYVNDKCINCAACHGFAPDTFSRSTSAHIVHQQPQTDLEILHARQALQACPVAAIRVDSQDSDQWLVDQMSGKKSNQKQKTASSSSSTIVPETLFPRPFLDNVPDVYWVGHHNEASFGAVPYLLRVKGDNDDNNDDVWVMIDSPKFSLAAVRDITSLTGPAGPDYVMLTHVDDSADHKKWAEHFFGNLKRIFHSGDLGRYNWRHDQELEKVEVLLGVVDDDNESSNNDPSSGLTAFALNGTRLPVGWETDPQTPSAVVLHTPGHSPGSITLYRRPDQQQQQRPDGSAANGILFTGDTYAYSTQQGRTNVGLSAIRK